MWDTCRNAGGNSHAGTDAFVRPCGPGSPGRSPVWFILLVHCVVEIPECFVIPGEARNLPSPLPLPATADSSGPREPVRNDTILWIAPKNRSVNPHIQNTCAPPILCHSDAPAKRGRRNLLLCPQVCRRTRQPLNSPPSTAPAPVARSPAIFFHSLPQR